MMKENVCDFPFPRNIIRSVFDHVDMGAEAEAKPIGTEIQKLP